MKATHGRKLLNGDIANLSIGQGDTQVTPLQMAQAMAIIGNGGTFYQTRLVQQVQTVDNEIVTAFQVRAKKSLDASQETMEQLRTGMINVVNGPAGTAHQASLENVEVAGKTGTTNDNTDAWFIGLTPDLVAGVWLGFDKPVSIAAWAGGGSLAAPIFGRMLARYYAENPQLVASHAAAQWKPPIGVIMGELDRDSGQMADELTPADRRYTEYFVEGTEPVSLRADPWKLFGWGPIIF